MTSLQTLASPTTSILLLRNLILTALGVVGCSEPATVGPCEGTRSDGLQTCGEALVRVEPPQTACVKSPDVAGSCATDADCGAEQACYCGPLGANVDNVPFPETAGRCILASCRTSADCGAGNHCVAVELAGCEGDVSVELHCTTGDDECVGPGCGCTPDPDRDGALTCGGGGCGRPFLVEGSVRTAAVTARSDWSAELVGPAQRVPELATFWLRTAQLEHASVAAFARFTMELLSLGAPADLVERASTAMADEVRHARVAFALASLHGGAPLGPGPLGVDGALDRGDVRSIVERLFLEGCVGETLAAAVARESAGVVEGADREALLRIADDEAEHAALAWRALAWLLETRRVDTEAGIAAALAGLDDSTGDPGLLEEAAAVRLRRDVFRSVVRPALAALGRRSDKALEVSL